MAGWEALSTDQALNRIDRIIVYAMIAQDTFTLDNCLAVFEQQACLYEPSDIKQSLARLELAFILQRKQQHYHFCVPLFKHIVLQQAPQTLLNNELIKLQ